MSPLPSDADTRSPDPRLAALNYCKSCGVDYPEHGCCGDVWVVRIAEVEKDRDHLAKFKAYVHERLDKAGVPVDPPSEHREKGCRIGGRLDHLLDALAAAEDGAAAAIREMDRQVDIKIRTITERDALAARLAGAERVVEAARKMWPATDRVDLWRELHDALAAYASEAGGKGQGT